MAEIKVDSNNFEEIVLKSDIPVLVDFWAPWCGPCQMLGPVLEKIAMENEGKVTVAKVNVDEEPNLALAYHISSIPALLLFKNGEKVKSTVGFQTKEKLMEFIFV